MARKPASVSPRAIPRPIPRLPPVTTTLRMEADELPCISHRQGGNKINCSRDLVRRQGFTAKPQNIDTNIAAASFRRALQDHIGYHQRASDGILFRAYQR